MNSDAVMAEARDAVAFLDKVRAAKPDEKIAVGHDHWDRAEAALRAVAALSSPSTGEAVAWRCLNVHGDAFLTEDANGAHFWLKSGKPVQPLYLHPSPEMGEISREEIAREIDAEAFSKNPWDATEALAMSKRRVAALDKADAKLKENGLSREELGGLARSQPGSDAQERSPVPPLFGGWPNLGNSPPDLEWLAELIRALGAVPLHSVHTHINFNGEIVKGWRVIDLAQRQLARLSPAGPSDCAEGDAPSQDGGRV